MAKLLWEINRPGGYGVQREVVANTRIAAIAIAESEWLKDNDWMNECVGTMNDDGTPFVRPPIPTFTAKKISESRW